jgi:hypothetical protein
VSGPRKMTEELFAQCKGDFEVVSDRTSTLNHSGQVGRLTRDKLARYKNEVGNQGGPLNNLIYCGNTPKKVLVNLRLATFNAIFPRSVKLYDIALPSFSSIPMNPISRRFFNAG